jgi:hypothetical protein
VADEPENGEPKTQEPPFDRFSQLIGEGSLYAPTTFTDSELVLVAKIIGAAGIRIDLHCPECNQPSTFVLAPVVADEFENAYEPHAALVAAFDKKAPRPISTIAHLILASRWLVFRCSRQQSHKLNFTLRIEETKTARPNGLKGPFSIYSCIKIGQFPQHAELVGGRLRAVSKIATPIDSTELRRAVGLMSHDVAIGAFVYLRRVFERIIAGAWQRALESGEKLPDPNRLRMADKVAALKAHLPEIVVRHAKAYGILSQGLHELSEEECARAYPVLESSVVAMLEDIHAHAQKQQRDQALSVQLDELAGTLKSSKS